MASIQPNTEVKSKTKLTTTAKRALQTPSSYRKGELMFAVRVEEQKGLLLSLVQEYAVTLMIDPHSDCFRFEPDTGTFHRSKLS